MKEKKFLIWIDILGFEKLAEKIGKDKGIDLPKIREDFVGVIKEKVKEVKEKGIIIGQNYGHRDDWILVAENLQKAFLAISEILDHNTRYKDYEQIPLEIAIGSAEYDKWARFNGVGLICEDKTIEWLKTYIVNEYHKQYKKEHNQPIKQTFVLISNSVYAELKENQKKKCKQYQKDKGGKVEYFYYLPLEVIERERKISDFLQKIGQTSEYSGALIDKIFVPPDEFDEIKERLEEDRIVFITGTSGYGKTYTAIRLLWEWYNKEYTPQWVSGKELANIDAFLKPHHIIYFEDPFGKTRYERIEDLKQRINFIINSVRNKEDVYVIITSRKDVFEEFKKESYSVEEIEQFEKELNILKPSYNYEKRKELLEKWAEEKECKWLKNEELKKIVFEALGQEKLLTPLSIHDFAEATVKIANEDDLRQKIDAYSKTVEMAFADEIKGLYDSGRSDRVLFLSFIFISEAFELSEAFEVDFVKQEYEALKGEDFEDFELILKEEYRVKVEEWFGQRILKFAHPSYSNVLPYILGHPGCKEIFCKVLMKLSDKDETAGAVASAVVMNFDKLPDDARNLLFTLSEKDKAAGDVAKAVTWNYDKLPENVRNELLLKLSEKNEAAKDVAWVVAENFNELPKDIRNLLFKLSEKNEATGDVASAVAENYDELPEDVRNLLFKLSEKDEAAGDVAWAVKVNFDKLPENVRNKLLFKLSEKDKAAGDVAKAVAENFDELPKNVRSELLLTLSEKDEAASAVASAVVMNCDELPEDVRNELLLKLSEKDEAAELVAWTVDENYNKLPEDVRNELLLKLSEKDKAADVVASIVAENYDELPEDVRDKAVNQY